MSAYRSILVASARSDVRFAVVSRLTRWPSVPASGFPSTAITRSPRCVANVCPTSRHVTCLLVGHTFATHRGDRVIAVDGNPDAGTLGHRVRRETTANLTSLLADATRIERYADIRGYTSQAGSRLEVVASDD